MSKTNFYLYSEEVNFLKEKILLIDTIINNFTLQILNKQKDENGVSNRKKI